MEFDAYPYQKEKHYELIERWSHERNLPAPDPAQLPPLGCVVYARGNPICAGFLFELNTMSSVIANLISDKKAIKNDRANAVDFMLISLMTQAKEMLGKTTVMVSSNYEPAKRHFESLGFIKESENVTIYRKDL